MCEPSYRRKLRFLADKGITTEVPCSVRNVSYTCCRTCFLLVTQQNKLAKDKGQIWGQNTKLLILLLLMFQRHSKASTIANLQNGSKVVAKFHSDA